MDAMKREMDVIRCRKVWSLVQLPEDKNLIGCRWVFTVKRNEVGEIARYKARLVAQGFLQKKGESYDETFSPVVNFALVRLFFTVLVCFYGWSHKQLDVNSAYLYAPISEVIYMKQPPGFADQKRPNLVCKLNRALYGLHQSGREWFHEINNKLVNKGFQKISWANCVYTYQGNTVLLLYVDDIVVFGRTCKQVKIVVDILTSEFDIKDLGKTRKLLGVEFEEVEGKLYIHQNAYIEKIRSVFSKYKLPITSLPIAKGVVLSKTQCPQTEIERKEMEFIPYRSAIGYLSFLASRTRPDISYATNILSQFQSNPGMVHWDAVLKLLGYVCQRSMHKLELSGVRNLNLNCYSDANFASNRDDRTSMGGMIILIDKTPIMWKTFKQKCVSLSTMESEYVSLAEAVKELVWFTRIVKECIEYKIINFKSPEINLFCDNQAAISFCKSPIENHATKHISVKLHFIRNLLNDKIFKLKYVNTKENLADIFTRAFTKQALFEYLKNIRISV